MKPIATLLTVTMFVLQIGVPCANAESPEAVAQSKEHLRAGNAYYKAGDYDHASAEYLESYRLMPRSILLFNIAQAHRLAGHTNRALRYYQMFLTAQPTGPGTVDARKYVATLEAEQKAAEQAKADVRAKSEAKSTSTEPKGVPVLSPPQEPTRNYLANPQVDENAGSNLRIAGTVVGIAGIAAATVGVLKLLSASSKADEISKRGSWTDAGLDQLPAAISDGQSTATLAYVLLAAGGALAVTGGTLYYFGAKAGHKVEVAIVPTVSRETAGLSAVGRF